ncbi:MAG: ribonuclease D, partial [Desulfatitalea sp.]|nr:HRDC domain-containing protein [Desulfatitalea sp.]NNK02133.1 ribonuclease D [Desulfatitalea sp.]
VKEACCHLSQVRPQENHPPLFIRFRGAGRLNPRQLAVLERLLRLRDAIARQKDRPLFKVISNSALLKIATAIPQTQDALKACQALSDKQLDMYAAQILKAVVSALQLPADDLPNYPRRRPLRLSPRIPQRVKALRSWRDSVAEQLRLDPALLFNKSLIREIAINKPEDLEALSRIETIHRWQVERFGKQLLSVLKSTP